MCIRLKQKKTIFPDTNTQTNSREQKTSHPSFVYLCIHLWAEKTTALHRKTLGRRNTDFLGYNTLDALVYKKIIHLRPDLSSTCW